MTQSMRHPISRIPAQAGIHLLALVMSPEWVPAFAGTRAGFMRA